MKKEIIVPFAVKLGEKLKGNQAYRKELNREFVCLFGNEDGITEHDIPVKYGITAKSTQKTYNCVMSAFGQKTNQVTIKKWLKKVIEMSGSSWSDLEIFVCENLSEIYGTGENRASIARKELLNKGIHRLVIKCSGAHYKDEDYFNAVDEAAKLFEIEVQTKARIADRSLSGNALMDSVFGAKGCLCLTKKEIQTEKNQESGLQHLAKSIVFLAKNPTSHEQNMQSPLQYSKDRCLDYLSLISIALKLLESCQFYKI